jgi:poly(3-hydroxybutyrate) depolymerase
MWTFLWIAIPLAAARQFSVSGMGSGAYMATQMHFAYSSDVISAGIISGGPYYCSQDTPEGRQNCKSRPWKISTKSIHEYIQSQSEAGTIDPISNLQSSSVYIYHGIFDTQYSIGVGYLGHEVYEKYIPYSNISTDYNLFSGHEWKQSSTEKLLTRAYGKLKYMAITNWPDFRRFNQTEYVDTSKFSGLDETGYIYVPINCQLKSFDCKVHVCFHDCGMNYGEVYGRFVLETSLNDWAEANEIMVIYPQITSVQPYANETGECWDFWGYTGSDYALKSGIQMKAVYDMVQNLPIKAFQ